MQPIKHILTICNLYGHSDRKKPINIKYYYINIDNTNFYKGLGTAGLFQICSSLIPTNKIVVGLLYYFYFYRNYVI